MGKLFKAKKKAERSLRRCAKRREQRNNEVKAVVTEIQRVT